MNRWLQGSACAALSAAILSTAAWAAADETAPPAPAAQPAPAAEPTRTEQATPAAVPPVPAAPPAPAGVADAPQYRVVDGNHVDAGTMKGWRTWRAMACERCHGANQEGLVGPSLVDDLKTQTKEEFRKCVLEGRVDKGMPNFDGVKSVTDNIDNLYLFLKGRSDGAIPTGNLKEIQ